MWKVILIFWDFPLSNWPLKCTYFLLTHLGAGGLSGKESHKMLLKSWNEINKTRLGVLWNKPLSFEGKRLQILTAFNQLNEGWETLRKSVLGAVGQSQQVSSGRALSMSQQLVVWRHRACEREGGEDLKALSLPLKGRQPLLWWKYFMQYYYSSEFANRFFHQAGHWLGEAKQNCSGEKKYFKNARRLLTTS